MKITKTIEVYIAKKCMPQPIDMVQYDTGIQLVLNMRDFRIPDGTTCTLFVQKPSGKFIYQEIGITVSETSIAIDLENQAITERGNALYQIRLQNGEDPERCALIAEEFADVMMYGLQLMRTLDIDITGQIIRKIDIVDHRPPKPYNPKR
jgi:hypothetical protein